MFLRHIFQNRVGALGLLNVVAYLSVFGGRIVRDSVVFTSTDGQYVFPIGLVLGAVALYWFGGKIEKEDALDVNKSYLKTWFLRLGSLLALSCVFLYWCDSSGFASAEAKGFDRLLYGMALLFYIVITELLAFLSLNAIWFFGGGLFGKSEQEREFPKLSAAGFVGMAVAASLLLINPLDLTDIMYAWPVFAILLAGISVLAIRLLAERQPNASLNLIGETHDKESSGFGWLLTNRYVFFFAIITICNFALISIIDQSLVNVANVDNVPSDKLAQMMSLGTLGFAVAGYFMQIFGFPRLFKKYSVAQLNLGAPTFLLIGVVLLAYTSSDFIKGAFNVEGASVAFTVLVFARIAGWVAEYLFNQSLIPYIYAALDNDDQTRARQLIEGPLTAFTNGIVGMLLLAYFAAADASNAGTFTSLLDLLSMISIALIIVMFMYSFRLTPAYRELLQVRALRRYDEVEAALRRGARVDIDHSIFDSEDTLIAALRVGNERSVVEILDQIEPRYVNSRMMAQTVASAHRLGTRAILNKTGDVLKANNVAATRELTHQLQLLASGHRLPGSFVAWAKEQSANPESRTHEALVDLYGILGSKGIDGANQIINEHVSGKEKISGIEEAKIRLAISTQLGTAADAEQILQYFSDHPDHITTNAGLHFGDGGGWLSDQRPRILKLFDLLIGNIPHKRAASFETVMELIREYPELAGKLLLGIHSACQDDTWTALRRQAGLHALSLIIEAQPYIADGDPKGFIRTFSVELEDREVPESYTQALTDIIYDCIRLEDWRSASGALMCLSLFDSETAKFIANEFLSDGKKQEELAYTEGGAVGWNIELSSLKIAAILVYARRSMLSYESFIELLESIERSAVFGSSIGIENIFEKLDAIFTDKKDLVAATENVNKIAHLGAMM